MTRVSVVTPFLDAERYLEQAIASVVAQTLADWELLLVDDGSRDRSLAIAEAAARSDPRIRLITASASAARGAAAARNRGIAAASSDLIAFLDADDLYQPEKLAVDVEVLDAQPRAAMVYGPTEWWRDEPKPFRWIEAMHRESGRLHVPPVLLNRAILANAWRVPCTCSVTIRRDAILAVGGFEESFRLYEDQTLWAKLFLAYPVYVQGRCLARYRQHPGSTSARTTGPGADSPREAHRSRARFLEWLAAYIERQGFDDRSTRSAMRLARAPYCGSGPQRLVDLARLAGRRQLQLARLRAYQLKALVIRREKAS